MSHDLKISANAKKFDIRGGSKLEVFDESGKLVHKGEFKSFTSNFLKLLYGSMVGAGTTKAKNLSGNNIEMDSFPQCTMNMGGGSGNYQFGLVVGTGDSAVGVNEYALVSPATGLNYGNTVIGFPSVGSTSISVEISRQIGNATGFTVALKEAGLICGVDVGTTGNTLVARDLLNVTLETGKKSTWRYTINFNFTAENGGFVKGLADNFAKLFTEITAAASWEKRTNFRCVVFDGKMWIMGGVNFTWAIRNDVWYSTDGITWTQATSSASWSARSYFGCVVYDGKMWVMGGNTGSARVNDVWYSTNGITWTQATSSAPWVGREGFCCVVYDGKMWVMGGNTGSAQVNDVWYSTDGITWTQATSSASWSARSFFGCVVYDGKMWVMGGSTGSAQVNDVWYSTNGITWTQATSSAPWVGRKGFGCVVYDGKMWVLGGFTNSGRVNDVWYSTDGITWTQATSSASWGKKQDFGCVVYDGKMWIMGGYESAGNSNDVWCSVTMSLNASIMVGSSDSSFSATATALGSLIANGTASGRLVYGNMPDTSTKEPYITGNKTKFSLAREFSNGSGADITIREVGLFSGSTMLARLILENPITLANGESEIITIDFETEV